MLWKRKDAEKRITPAQAKETFVQELVKLISKCRDAGMHPVEIERVLKAHAQTIEWQRTMGAHMTTTTDRKLELVRRW